MTLLALTHQVSSRIGECETTFVERKPFHFAILKEQHRAYGISLAAAGATVKLLSDNLSMPDSCFIEDTAIVLDSIAVVTSLGAQSRRGETAAVAQILRAYREVVSIEVPATIDGGDVLVIGKRIYVGISTRTNAPGVEKLSEIVTPRGFQVIPVNVHGSLHLKTACTAVNDDSLLVNSEWIDTRPLSCHKLLHVAKDEPWAANTLRVNETLFLQSGFPATREIVEKYLGPVATIDISEFRKAEAGLTCLSLIFNE